MHIVDDLEVTQYHRRSTHSAARPDRGTASDTDTTGHGAMWTDRYVMSDLYLVVENDTIPDRGVLKGSPIDRRVRPDRDIVTDQDAPNLGNPYPCAAIVSESEAIATDHRTGLNDATLTQLTLIRDYDAGAQAGIGTDPRAGANETPGSNDRARSNTRSLRDRSAMIDLRPPIDRATGIDESRCSNSRLRRQ